MKNKLLFCIMITFLAVCSALFARYFTKENIPNDALPVMAYGNAEENYPGITFTHLAEKVNSIVNGVSA